MANSDDPGFLAPNETRLTRLACPDCGGVLAQIDLPQISFYRCHVGHQYGPQSLQQAQADTVDAKLWSTVAALEERAVLNRHLADHARTHHGTATTYLRAAERSTELAEWIRAQLELAHPPDPPD